MPPNIVRTLVPFARPCAGKPKQKILSSTFLLSALIGLQLSAGPGLAVEGTDQERNQTPEIARYPQGAAQHNVPPESIKRFLPSSPDAFVQKDLENGNLKLVAWTKYLNKPDKIWASRIQLISMKDPRTPKVCWQSDEEELYQPEIITRPDWYFMEATGQARTF